MGPAMRNPIRLYMSMSLDGCIAGPDDRPGQEPEEKAPIKQQNVRARSAKPRNK